MAINKASFYKKVKVAFFGGKLSQSQVDGMESILNEWEKTCPKGDIRHLAYILATTYHETAATMAPIEEYGRGAGRKYGKKIKMSGQTYDKPDKVFYGRGYVQLTWYENYEKMGALLKIDLLNHPEYALNPYWAAKIMFEGMLTAASAKGDFTGKHLDQYFNKTTEDPINARRIINGLDQAAKIAAHYHKFLNALT